MKSIQDQIDCKSNNAKEKISEHENIALETAQNGIHRGKNKTDIKQPNLTVVGSGGQVARLRNSISRKNGQIFLKVD